MCVLLFGHFPNGFEVLIITVVVIIPAIESEGICFHRRWFVCVCLFVCDHDQLTKKKLWTDLHQILCEGS